MEESIKEAVDVLSLPCYKPADEFGQIEVMESQSKTGTKLNQPLYLNRKAVKHMTTTQSYRELLQNMIDAMVEVNDGYVDMNITRTKRKNDDVTVFHTSTHRLGEVTVSQDR